MRVTVIKYGGASLRDVKSIQSIADRLSKRIEQGESIVIVVSAMGSTTDELTKLAHQVDPIPPPREVDMLLTAGERISMTLLSIALNARGHHALSLTGSQAGICTRGNHNEARIEFLRIERIWNALASKKTVVLAGFQGVDTRAKDVTTLGRGGSDTTAIALSIALGSPCCEIHKEFGGISSADPARFSNTRKQNCLSWESLTRLSFWGAQLIHYRASALAKRYRMPIKICEAQAPQNYTLVRNNCLEGKKMMHGSQKPLEDFYPISLTQMGGILKISCSRGEGSLWFARLENIFSQKGIPIPRLHSLRIEDEEDRILMHCDIRSQALLPDTPLPPWRIHTEGVAVTLVFEGCLHFQDVLKCLEHLSKSRLKPWEFTQNPGTLTWFFSKEDGILAEKILHKFFFPDTII